MLINLLEIPPSGRDFSYSQKNSKMAEYLSDVITNPFQAELTITPMSIGTFELRGTIKSAVLEDCSRCGIEFDLDVNEKFYEILMPKTKDQDYGSGTHKVGEEDLSGPSVCEYEGHHFNIAEYLHEVVVISRPLIPAPKCDATGNCVLCKKNVVLQSFNYEDPGFEKPVSPFATLKDLKVTKN